MEPAFAWPSQWTLLNKPDPPNPTHLLLSAFFLKKKTKEEKRPYSCPLSPKPQLPSHKLNPNLFHGLTSIIQSPPSPLHPLKIEFSDPTVGPNPVVFEATRSWPSRLRLGQFLKLWIKPAHSLTSPKSLMDPNWYGPNIWTYLQFRSGLGFHIHIVDARTYIQYVIYFFLLFFWVKIRYILVWLHLSICILFL